jgi:hypothetical protein
MCIATHRAAVRLACVKHAASVQSEPGSNSPLYIGKLNLLTRYNHFAIISVLHSKYFYIVLLLDLISSHQRKYPHLLLGLIFKEHVSDSTIPTLIQRRRILQPTVSLSTVIDNIFQKVFNVKN